GGNDITLGNGTHNVTTGGRADTIRVGNGAGTINSGGGNDHIILGKGDMTIDGGAGNDTFEFDAGRYAGTSGIRSHQLILGSPSGRLTVSDFDLAHDRIDFRDATFDLGVNEGQGTGTPQQINPSLLSANSNGTFATAGNRFAYKTSTGSLYYDQDG